MIGVGRRLRASLGRFIGNARGNASVEFVVAFPFLCFFLFGFGEVGTMTTRMVMLERGLDIAMREVRIGSIPRNISAEAQRDIIKTNVCRGAFLLASCLDELTIAMNAIPIGDPIPNNPIECVDRTPSNLTPPGALIDLGTLGSANDELIIVEACIVVNPVFPFAGWFAGTPLFESDGTTIRDYALASRSAFLNEP